MSKLHMTSRRQVILEELRKTESHLTADQVYRRVRRTLPRISLGTVYRNLEVLAQNGLIGKLELAGAQKRFDRNPANHYHVRCIQCGKTEDAPMEPLKSIDHSLHGKSDYQILGHHLEFVGLCPSCKGVFQPGNQDLTNEHRNQKEEEAWS